MIFISRTSASVSKELLSLKAECTVLKPGIAHNAPSSPPLEHLVDRAMHPGTQVSVVPSRRIWGYLASTTFYLLGRHLQLHYHVYQFPIAAAI